MLVKAGLTAALAVVVFSVTLIAQDRVDFRDSPYLRIDPERIVLSDRDSRTPCGECHASEYEVWQETEHARGFDTMHRSASARDILHQMDLTVTKRKESLCMRCHYTVGPQLNAIAGVSCESCHGAARDWIAIHNSYGEGVDQRELESPEHRRERLARSESAGMLRPSGDLYAVAANCFECHTVPVEELVNVGGHRSGTDDFNLPERMKSIRHNFVHEQWGATSGNRAPTPERDRLMFVLGRMLAYEYTLRGLAEASMADGSYYRSMHRRVVSARGRLEEVGRVVQIPAVARILDLGRDADLRAGQGALVEVADAMREAGQEFARTADHPNLGALDPLVEGRPAPPPATTAAAADTLGQQLGSSAGRDGAPAEGRHPAGGTPANGGGSAAVAASIPPLPGQIRNRPTWITPPERQYLGDDGECMSCHRQAEDWWATGGHAGGHATLARLNDPRAVEIATLYGIGPSGMVRADEICMNCHGTPLNAAIVQPVGCESCHGPAADYLDPHSEGGNPQLGMNALKDPVKRAETCARCHHVSDERLLSAGHPSGAGFDLAKSSADLSHWPDGRVQRKRDGGYPEVRGEALAQAYSTATAGRPAPRVTVAKLPPRSPSQAGPSRTSPAGGSAARANTSSAPRAQRGGSTGASSEPPRAPRTVPVTQGSSTVSLDLEPIPAAVDSLTTEDILLLVKQRLERVYAALRGSR